MKGPCRLGMLLRMWWLGRQHLGWRAAWRVARLFEYATRPCEERTDIVQP